MARLLEELDRSGSENRAARFVCSLAIASGEGELLYKTEGVCEGRLAAEPRGSEGFGYDPIFIPDGFHDTFGEMPALVKRKISHRARAIEQIIPFLQHFTGI